MYRILLFVMLLQSGFVFAAVEAGRWQLGIGDPTLFGWLTVLIYFAASLRCVFKANQSKKFGGNHQFWWYLAAFLLLLGINKQLDLQSWFTESLRHSAKIHGWYAYRRLLQLLFIVVLGISMLVALFAVRLFLANSWRRYKLTWLGIILLSTFILTRAASFHHFDMLINRDFAGIKMNVVMEISALLLIILGTFINKKSRASLLGAQTFPMVDYVEIANTGDDVQCPNCGLQPLSKTIAGRVFKCRSCGTKFNVNMLSH